MSRRSKRRAHAQAVQASARVHPTIADVVKPEDKAALKVVPKAEPKPVISLSKQPAKAVDKPAPKVEPIVPTLDDRLDQPLKDHVLVADANWQMAIYAVVIAALMGIAWFMTFGS